MQSTPLYSTPSPQSDARQRGSITIFVRALSVSVANSNYTTCHCYLVWYEASRLCQRQSARSQQTTWHVLMAVNVMTGGTNQISWRLTNEPLSGTTWPANHAIANQPRLMFAHQATQPRTKTQIPSVQLTCSVESLRITVWYSCATSI